MRLTHNDIVSIPEGCFVDSRHLVCLDLSFNRIRNLDVALAFEALEGSLQELYLEGNRLPHLGPGELVMKNIPNVVNSSQKYAASASNMTNMMVEARNRQWFKKSQLRILNLSQNRIHELGDVKKKT